MCQAPPPDIPAAKEEEEEEKFPGSRGWRHYTQEARFGRGEEE